MKKTMKILFPTDFSELANEVFFVAAEYVRQLGGRMILIHVVDNIQDSSFFARVGFPERKFHRREGSPQHKAFEELLKDERAHGLVVRPLLAVGVPDVEIVNRAKRHQVDLIIMSTHGRSGMGRFLLGSVAESVVRKAPCPVLTLNPVFLSNFKKGETRLSLIEIEGAGL